MTSMVPRSGGCRPLKVAASSLPGLASITDYALGRGNSDLNPVNLPLCSAEGGTSAPGGRESGYAASGEQIEKLGGSLHCCDLSRRFLHGTKPSRTRL